MKKIIVSLLGLVLIGSTLLFSPWVTEGFAMMRAIHAFEEQWKNVQDGCGFNCKDCGFKSSSKTMMGRKVVVEYACGMLPSDSPEYHKKRELFVSFIGTVH